MITGRFVKRVYCILLRKSVYNSHVEEIKKAPGFVAAEPPDRNPMLAMRGLVRLYFASPYERDAFGDSHPKQCLAALDKDGKEVFIKPYRKGKERNNPEAYEAKTYRNGGGDEEVG